MRIPKAAHVVVLPGEMAYSDVMRAAVRAVECDPAMAAAAAAARAEGRTNWLNTNVLLQPKWEKLNGTWMPPVAAMPSELSASLLRSSLGLPAWDPTAVLLEEEPSAEAAVWLEQQAQHVANATDGAVAGSRAVVEAARGGERARVRFDSAAAARAFERFLLDVLAKQPASF